MKTKHLFACAGLAALSGAASAQGSVTIYGLFDAGVQLEDSSAGKTVKVVSGGRSGTRLGFRGTEDLGGGLSALWLAEHGINLDTGGLGQGGRFFGRQVYVGLKGGFGTLAAGRIATFGAGTGSFDMFGEVDPLATAFGIAGVGSTMSTAAGLRVDNTLLYQTPDMSGFQAGVLHSLQAVNNEVPGRGNNIYLTGAGAKLAKGPLYAAVTYEQANNPAGAKDEKHLQVGAAWDFKVVRLHAAYGRELHLFSTALNVSGTTNGAGAKSWMGGITAPVGSGIVRASYQKRDGDEVGGENRDVRVISAAYEYFFSKRTSAYAVVADSDGKGTLDNNPTYDRRQYTVGLMHKF
jgi:predicted porin